MYWDRLTETTENEPKARLSARKELAAEIDSHVDFLRSIDLNAVDSVTEDEALDIVIEAHTEWTASSEVGDESRTVYIHNALRGISRLSSSAYSIDSTPMGVTSQKHFVIDVWVGFQ